MTAFLISLLNLVKSNRFYYYIQFVPPLETTMLEIIININVNIIIITIYNYNFAYHGGKWKFTISNQSNEVTVLINNQLIIKNG